MAAGVQSMCEFWKKFDLQELQKELDSTATDVANRQDESDTSRKRLVELSREFKKNTPEDIRKVVSPLLKHFQAEIDSLSKRSKAAEASFLSVYKRLIDLPDPVSVLEYAQQLQKKAHRVQDLEIENKQLRETLDEYNHEFAEVKNQEVTIKQLRERLKEGEDKIDAVAEARTKEKERDLQKTFVEKERQLQETQLSVARKLGEAEQRVTSLTYTLENVQSELFEVKAKYDEATTAKHDEMEMVMSDLERANERATAAEREAEKLKHQLTNLTATLSEGAGGQANKGPDMEQAIEILQRSNLEAELAAKEKEITQLVEDVQRLQGSLQKLRENTTQQVGRLEEEIASKNKAFRMLEDRLKTQEDYEEIKRELGVLKSIEFSSGGGSGQDEVDGDMNKTKSLEMLLLEKNKSLQTLNTQLKVNCSDLSGHSSPSFPSQMKDFTRSLGEEIAVTYQDKTSSPTPKQSPISNGLPTPASVASVASISPPPTPTFSPSLKKEHGVEQKSPSSVDSGDIPPQVSLCSPNNDMINNFIRSPSSSSDPLRIPRQSPHFFHPAFNNQLMANFMGMGVNFNNNNSPKSEVNGCQGLDTSMVAKTVRELLSIHNIGQRLFAKHVLGLSQGTVSELLSKPKSWDKLTEKGRESYRKMHTWAIDDRNIMALKAISPKKGTQPLLPSIQHEDAATEKRIAHILNEAQQAMQHKKSLEHVWSKEHQNAMVTSIYQEMARFGQMHVSHALPLTSPTSCLPPMLHGDHGRKLSDSDGPRVRPGDKIKNDFSSKEMVERIYRQELIKLAKAAENAGNIGASALYQQELARLAQSARIRDDPEPGEVRHLHGSPERMDIKSEPQDRDSSIEDMSGHASGPIDLSKRTTSTPSTPTSGDSEKSLNSSAHAASAFFQMHPKVNGHGVLGHSQAQAQDLSERSIKTEGPGSLQTTPTSVPHSAFPHFAPSDTSSPLQRMQNIANSLMNRSQLGPQCNKPLKAVLPPITQDEFDNYANINTEDLVKQVKETLSQYSISQRLFGESVLGLSQGSVSDLLARPKPWHMLTQKGREPFIRMQLFLEDSEAIPKLVASQYHIAPDKLMRSNSMGKELDPEQMNPWQNLRGSMPLPGLPGLPLVSQPMNLGLPVPQIDVKPSVPAPPTPVSRPPLPSVPLMLPSVTAIPPAEPQNLALHPSHPQHPLFPAHHPAAGAIATASSSSSVLTQPPALSHWSSSFSYPSSMLEVVAMTSEIDTLELTSRVKDVLQFNNLGQKLFGEAVIGLSQGSVSELLSKPKPWHMLSIKGREPFIKMHLWLSDPHNVDRLKHYQNEIKANRRRRHSIEERYDSSIALPKRPRVFFSEEQKERLRQAYNRDPYPNQNTIEALANSLGVGVKTVINWFHNHRMRAKQQQHASSPTTPYSEFSQSGIAREESNDDNSNNSDISSMSAENREAMSALNFHSRFINPDSNQWMFPKFEPVNAGRSSAHGSQGSENHDGSDGEEGGHEEGRDEVDMDEGSDAKDMSSSLITKDFDRDEEGDLEGDDHSISDDSHTEKSDKDSDVGGKGVMTTSGSVGSNLGGSGSGSNRRKRSHPQYVSAGRHLDRTVQKSELLENNNDIIDIDSKGNNDTAEDSRNNSLVDSDQEGIESGFKGLKEKNDSWEDKNNGSNIDKIQNTISQHSGEDWEF